MKYSISISKKGDSENKEVKITADITNGISPSFRSEKGGVLNNYEIIVEDFLVDKQIYAPNLVKLQLLVKVKSDQGIIGARKELRANFIGSTLSVSQTFTNSKEKDEVLEVAREYPVIDLKCNSNRSQISMELFAYSPDRYAALNKHSEAFTGRTIDEILKTAIQKPFGCNYDINNTQHLHYMMKKDAQAEEEERQYHRIPYAVQYNESTYSFISRLAKRHGEFLFFEDRALCVGCKQDYADLKNEAIKIKGEDIINISFEDSTSRAYTRYAGTNYLAEPKENENMTDRQGQYKMFSPKEEDSSATKLGFYNIVNTEYANNDSYVDIRNDLTIGDRVNKADEDSFLKNPKNFKLEDDSLLKLHSTDFYLGGSLTAIGDILSQGSYVDMGMAAAMNVKTLTYDAFQNAVAINTAYMDNIKDDEKKWLQSTRYNDGPYGQSKLKYPEHFAFVSYVAERSREAYDNRIFLQLHISFSDNRLRLGSLIALVEKDETTDFYYYIVTAIHIKREETDGKVSMSKMLPCIFLEAIPYINPKDGGTIPYFDPADLKREASAQVAIVVDTKDPYRLNRVRVCYPWQFVDKAALLEEDPGAASKDYRDLKKDALRKNASPWIRVATPAAKGGGGFVFTPELYSEVLVNYENGNIDKPYVESSVFRMGDELFDLSANNEHTSSISSHHGQKIIFHDGNNGEAFFAKLIGPAADLGLGFMSADGIKGAEKIAPFDGYTEITDNYGLNSVKLSTSDREISIRSSWGNVNINALTGISIEAANGDIDIKGKNVSISAGNKLSITSGTHISRPSRVSSTKLSVIKAVSDNIGLNFSLLRTIIEAIFKPVGGSMVIKSNRYLCLEAGRGNAKVSAYVKQNPLKPKEVSELQVLPIKEPLLHFIRVFDNCKVAMDLVREKERAYRNLYEAEITGCVGCLNGLKESLMEDKKSHIDNEFKKLVKPEEVVAGETFSRVNVSLDIDFGKDLKRPEDVDEVMTFMTNTLLLEEALNAYSEAMFCNKNKLFDEINQVSEPLRNVIKQKLFAGTVPSMKEVCTEGGTEYALVRQAINGEIAAKRILLLAVVQLMQEAEIREAFNVDSSVVVLDLPEPIEKILERFVKKAPIRTIVADVLPKEKVQLLYNVKLKGAEALSADEMAEINASWRFIVNNLFTDEEMSWKDMWLEAITLDGLKEDMPLFLTKEGKGQQLDRGTLDDGKILFSDDRHITYSYDSRMKEFIVSDSSFDNEISGKLKEVMNSLEED